MRAEGAAHGEARRAETRQREALLAVQAEQEAALGAARAGQEEEAALLAARCAEAEVAHDELAARMLTGPPPLTAFLTFISRQR